ncbi:hypothetical protein [Haloarchaeobius sp. HRN-SO-5]|uniref:hypothetical protein n=1 Tax=Haloarchaeobius sp. HRN-SO-5 TaxID=3446118 RepID=UPI003EBBB7E4
MRRRTALTALTGVLTSLAGCNELADGRSRPTFGVETTASWGDDTSNYPSQPPADPAVGAVATLGTPKNVLVLPSNAGVDPSFTVGFTRGGDEASPVRLWVGLTNTQDWTERFVFDGAVPFDGFVGRPARTGIRRDVRDDEEGPELWLVPRDDPTFDEVRPDAPTDDCWRGRSARTEPPERRFVSLDPGDTVGQEFVLVTPPDAAACLPAGAYRFASERYDFSFVLSVWVRTDRTPPESRFAGASVPSPKRRGEVRWFHDARSNDASTYLVPGAERVDAPTVLDCTLHNFGRDAVNTGGVQLFRLEDGRWWQLLAGGFTISDYARIVYPGQAASVTVGLGTDEGDEWVPALRPGRYAVQWGVLESGAATAAVVDVADAPAVELTPTDHVVGTGRRDDTLVVKSSRVEAVDLREEATLEVRRTDVDAASRLLLERAVASDGLRNTLSYLDGDETLDAARLTTSSAVVSRAQRAVRNSDRFSFRGETYVAERHDPDANRAR